MAPKVEKKPAEKKPAAEKSPSVQKPRRRSPRKAAAAWRRRRRRRASCRRFVKGRDYDPDRERAERKKLKKRIRDETKENGCWPSLKTLFLLRLWSMIFPCSDFRHVVMTPAILLMCEYLMRCPISSGHDIAMGCFICSMVLSVSKQSRKFSPEAVIFLRTLLMAATDRVSILFEDSEFYQLRELKALRPLLRLHDSVMDIVPLNFLTVVEMPEDSAFFSSDSFRASVVANVVETLKGFVEIYKDLSSFPESFLPISMLTNSRF